MAQSGGEYTRKTIPIKSISLDLENPRYVEEGLEKGIHKWTEKKLEEHILTETSKQDVDDILPSIISDGVTDPIWVQETKPGKYTLVEGNRRIIVLRELVRKKQKPPNRHVRYDQVIANVYPRTVNQAYIEGQKLRLQTGKKKWGPFNMASQIYKLVKKQRYSPEEAAKWAGMSIAKVEEEIENYQYFKELQAFSKTSKYGKFAKGMPGKYTYFQKASNVVRDRFFGNKIQRQKFYKLILPDPKTGKAKIPNVSLKDGLIKNFNKFANDERILKKFLSKPTFNSEQALLEYEGGDLKKQYPWVKKLKEVSNGLAAISRSDKTKIKKDQTILKQIKQINKNASEFLK